MSEPLDADSTRTRSCKRRSESKSSDPNRPVKTRVFDAGIGGTNDGERDESRVSFELASRRSTCASDEQVGLADDDSDDNGAHCASRMSEFMIERIRCS
jgi:hypothetical protein